MKKEDAKELAKRRAQVILSVQAGKQTATDGARALGISRKTYYEWETRALSGMMEALMDRPAGRPTGKKEKEKDPELRELVRAIQELSERAFLEEQLEGHQKILEAYPGLQRLIAKGAGHEKKTEPPRF